MVSNHALGPVQDLSRSRVAPLTVVLENGLLSCQVSFNLRRVRHQRLKPWILVPCRGVSTAMSLVLKDRFSDANSFGPHPFQFTVPFKASSVTLI